MSRYKKDLGDFGEAAAAACLEEKGYRILCRNYRTDAGEIDLVAMGKGRLAFVEVKTRSTFAYGRPAEAVDRKKQTHMRRAAAAWLKEHPTACEIGFDVIEVLASFRDGVPQVEELTHIPNIILEG